MGKTYQDFVGRVLNEAEMTQQETEDLIKRLKIGVDKLLGKEEKRLQFGKATLTFEAGRLAWKAIDQFLNSQAKRPATNVTILWQRESGLLFADYTVIASGEKKEVTIWIKAFQNLIKKFE